ncbi:MAG TPA: helix-turn-helix transcriptional regulator [Solirubrobacterales bacterium]|jgi:transcriptional regulator with XRE-family HTH domain|nr:helix-turn-helix transcriptional regulator [Solirubrobacterales bacterium]
MSDSPSNAGSALVGRIESLRRERGLTFEELATRADVDRPLLESLAGGAPDVGITVLVRLAGALGVDPSELLEGIDWVPDGRGGGEYRVADAE